MLVVKNFITFATYTEGGKNMKQQVSPFVFGRMAQGDTFTDRRKESERLEANFCNNINTVLISPRRWGKSSLVKKVAENVRKEDLRIIQLDAFPMRSEADFYQTLAKEVIKATSSKLDEWIETAKQFLGHIAPKLSLGSDPMNTFDLSFQWQGWEKDYADILNLPETIAIEKGIHIVICIDEFQNISTFEDPLLFQKRLRSVWQKHTQVAYCLYGSKQHMMMELFEKQSMPFYKFGEVMYLPKIALEDWTFFLMERFNSSGKVLQEKEAKKIAQSVQCQSYYVQQLAHLVWLKTDKSVTDEIIDSALKDLLDQNALLYQRETEVLTSYQVNFLKALACGITTNLSSKENLKRFNMGTSANVNRIKDALINKEIIDCYGKNVSFLDPAYELWFKKEMME